MTRAERLAAYHLARMARIRQEEAEKIETLGDLVRAVRLENNLTQTQLAAAIGISSRTVQDIEAGKASNAFRAGLVFAAMCSAYRTNWKNCLDVVSSLEAQANKGTK